MQPTDRPPQPVLMSPEMAHAAHIGAKTQTRRIFWEALDIGILGKRPHPVYSGQWAGAVHPARTAGWVAWFPGDAPGLAEFTQQAYDEGLKPRYRPGDLLWVKEAWATRQEFDPIKGADLAAAPRPPVYFPDQEAPDRGRPRHGMFMPRWAARTWLRVLHVRPERLHTMPERDLVREGMAPDLSPEAQREAFRALWDRLHGERPIARYERNPWVWVYSFVRETAPCI